MGIDIGRFRSKKNEDQWVDWLTDDPMPAELRQRAGRQQPTPSHQRARPYATAVRRPGERPHYIPRAEQATPVPTPALSKADQPKNRAHLKRILSAGGTAAAKSRIVAKNAATWVMAQNRRYVYGAAGTLAVMLIVGVGFVVIGGKDSSGTQTEGKVLSENSQAPEFAYVLPGGDKADIDTDVKYDAARKVVNYVDTIGGVDITISQQPLPSDFKADTQAKVKEIAEGFGASKAITTSNPTAYIGTDEKGPQTVIFAKNDLLIFMLSTKSIDEPDWAEYITNLR